MRRCPNCLKNRYKTLYHEPPYFVIKCRNCSLVFLGNLPDEKTLYESYYETTELDFDEYSPNSNHAHIRKLFAINQQRIHWLATLKKSGSLLDFGCGRGYFLKSAADAGFAVSGIDISEIAAEFVRNRFKLNATNETLDELIHKNRQFNIVTMWHVLEHFIEPYEALQKVRALLKTGGICVIEVPNLNSLKFRLSKNKWQGGNHPRYHRTFFTGTSLRQALFKTGFSSCRRAGLSYNIPDKPYPYLILKRGLNVFGLDAFLDFVAYK
jgi:2-polyprenyl-3-methyl-5-hydroxy-6-metoxy-1,4-benzoquinol methylase